MAVVSAIDFLGPHDAAVLGKPYSMRYEPNIDIPTTNYANEVHEQLIEDVRGREDAFSVLANGFGILPLKSELTYHEFDDKQKVQQILYRQVAHGVKDMLMASRVQVFEHVLRKRHPTFPIATGEAYKYDQPTTRAHIDLTPAWGAAMAEHMNAELGRALPSMNYKYINIWKPLRGPVRDWPLALCDTTTLESSDIVPSDLVYPATVVENCLVRSNARQKWYYLSNQTEHEAWVFLQADCNENGQLGVPHTSFSHPNTQHTDVPRESIEIRAIAYFDDTDGLP